MLLVFKISFSHNYNMKSFTRKKNLAWKEVNDKIVIIDLNGRRNFHQLNKMASFRWKECEQNVDITSLVKKVHENFNCGDENVEDDIKTFIDQLHQKELLVACE